MGFLNRMLGIDRESEVPLLFFLATALFIVSLVAGTREDGLGDSHTLFGLEFHFVSTLVWLLAGLSCLLCLQQLFHPIWINAIYLLGSYALAALGTLLFFIFYEEDYYWYIIALIPLFLSVGLLYWMTLEIYGLRARVLDVAPEEEERLTMGYWFGSLIVFLVLTILSYYFYAKHFCSLDSSTCSADGWFTFYDPVNSYIVTEVALFVVALFVLWSPMEMLSPYLELVPAEEAEMLTETPHALRTCPGCGQSLEARKYHCPECEAGADASFCAKCEAYTIACPGCGSGTHTGDECRKCGTANEGLHCAECGHTAPIRFWQTEGND